MRALMRLITGAAPADAGVPSAVERFAAEFSTRRGGLHAVLDDVVNPRVVTQPALLVDVPDTLDALDYVRSYLPGWRVDVVDERSVRLVPPAHHAGL